MGTAARNRLLWVLGGTVVVAGLGVLVWALRDFLHSEPAPAKQVVQEVRIIRPPPPPEDRPPPPPPPPDEKVDLPEPEPELVPSAEPPPGEQLGLDAEGSGTGDGFGLVGRPGGRDLLASSGSAAAWYAGLIKSEILANLNAQQDVRSGTFTAYVKLWIREDGSVERFTLDRSTGDPRRDRAIEAAMSRLQRISRPPPAATPQPISLRIVGRV